MATKMESAGEKLGLLRSKKLELTGFKTRITTDRGKSELEKALAEVDEAISRAQDRFDFAMTEEEVAKVRAIWPEAEPEESA